ncbi:DUF397 domain-containing protein [Micromonospora sp. NPDC048935]|uniref:DUF397 domain-containing protein n=1 Tax=Micromonospora sp. NPDC048935 TaxID=3364262 RepID=UPI0037217BAF
MTVALPKARWRQTLGEHQAVDGRCPICQTAGRCWEWAEAFAQLVAHDLLLPDNPTTGRTRPADMKEQHTMDELTFVRPNRCDNSGPNCVEVAIDADLNRIVRSSKRPGEQIIVDRDEWAPFVASIRAGQDF